MNILQKEESLSLPQALLRVEGMHQELRTHFVRIPLNHSVDILSWIERYTDRPFVYWCSRNKEEEWGGIDLAETHYASIRIAQERLKSLHPSIRAFGGMSFARDSDGWGEFGNQTFWVPKLCIYRKEQHYFLESTQLPHQTSSSYHFGSLLPDRYIPSQENWTRIIDETYEDFQQETLHKIVLARQSRLQISISPLEALRALKRQQSSTFDFAFSPYGNSTFIGCSPERLFSLHEQKLKTEALAGTRSKEIDPIELLQSEKDLREHLYVRDHILKQLRPISQKVTHGPTPRIIQNSNVIHLQTTIEASIKNDVSIEDILSVLHPTPAVCGLPQEYARKKISSFEQFDRGWYAGPIGWLSANAAEFAVGIRSALFHQDGVYVWAGAGIVEGSNAEQEWQEIETKSQQYFQLESK
ncbi:MAG: isochorismate synthase [Myxococcota bacterium]|nr:isochorismate synthase [Myxococcota bacterium]